jgi:hypothetical protein
VIQTESGVINVEAFSPVETQTVTYSMKQTHFKTTSVIRVRPACGIPGKSQQEKWQW